VVEQSNPAGEPQVQRRRTTRIVQTVPIGVAGTDALGQPFKERTSALVINCHGCKYQSKHYVLKNNWVTLEIPHPEAGQAPRTVRARVVWVQRPRTVQELFQVAVSLEVPGNVWGVAFPPDDWFPYPEEAAPSLPAPGQPEAEPPAAAEEAAAPAGKVRMLPAPPGPSPEAMATVERQVQAMIAEARRQIQDAVRNAASTAVTAETGKLLRDVESQLRIAARKSVEAVASQHLDEAVERALHKIEQTRQTANGAMRERWVTDFESMLGEAGKVLADRFAESSQQLREQFHADIHRTVEQASARLGEIEQRLDGLRGEIAGSAAAAQTRLDTLRTEIDAATGSAATEWRGLLESQSQTARGELQRLEELTQSLRSEVAAADAAARGRVQQLRAEMDAASAETVRRWQERLNAEAEAVLGHLRKTEQLAQKLQADLEHAGHTQIPQLRANWREQLESDMAMAGEEWNSLLGDSVAKAAQDVGRRLVEASDRAGREAEQEMSLRLAALKQSFAEAAADAQQALLAVRRDLEQDLYRSKSARDDLRASATQAEETALRLESLRQSVALALEQQFEKALAVHLDAISGRTSEEMGSVTSQLHALAQEMTRQATAQRDDVARTAQASAAELRQQAEGLTAEMARQAETHRSALQQTSTQHQESLVRRSEDLLAEAIARLHPVFEAESRKAVEQTVGAVDRQLGPRLDTAQRTLGELAAGQQRADEFLLAHRERIQRASDESAAQAERRLKDTLEQIGKEWDTVSRAQLEKCLAELEEKSTDATHTTFEALYKAADWYQKKAQTAMQSALEKATEQATDKLKDRAAEISRMFALELDHYSRSYTDHTKALLDESAKDVVAQNRAALEQAGQTSAAQFSDEVHRIAGEKLRVFAEESSTSRDEMMHQLDAHAERVQQRWVEFAGRSFTETQEKVAARAAELLAEAQREFQTGLLPILESWRADREAQHREWLEKLGQAGNASIEEYKQRLQNTSNTWMVASVTTLNQHSKTVMETLAAAAEARLRDACAQAVTGMADTLAAQLRSISAQLTATPPAPAKENSDT
jgi:hypothetical protein